MTCNVGGIERTIRVILGVLLLALAFYGNMPTPAAWVFGVLGGVAAVTGAVGFCPAWRLFGINTCRQQPSGKT